jgi:hypothetical protein|eukprot:4732299-Prymnesium_polylepis.2
MLCSHAGASCYFVSLEPKPHVCTVTTADGATKLAPLHIWHPYNADLTKVEVFELGALDSQRDVLLLAACVAADASCLPPPEHEEDVMRRIENERKRAREMQQ